MTSLGYDRDVFQVELDDPEQRISRWRYDALGRQVERVVPGPLGGAYAQSWAFEGRAASFV